MVGRSPYDNARMQGAQAAMSLARRLDLKKRVLAGHSGSVDVFAIIEELDVPFTFMELDKALGFCLPYPKLGIVVTTKASLHRQRYTAAHELGHAVMEHEGSIDQDILMRGGQSMTQGDLKEVEAEAFAAELLLPKWLLVHHMRRKGWTIAHHLPNPEVVYQLSLRVSASYEAVCWSLFGNELLPNRQTLDELLRAGRSLAKVKKEAIAPFDAHLGHSNALRLLADDSGSVFSISANDLIRVELIENVGGGYVWDSGTAVEVGFTVEYDDYAKIDETRIGSPTRRNLIFTPPPGEAIELILSERRPWERSLKPAQVFGATFDVLGPEKAGMSRARRRMLGLEVA